MADADERPVVGAVAAAILSGTPIDWPSIEASVSPDDRDLLEELRLLCTVADLHRDFPAVETDGAYHDQPPQYWGRLRLIERVGGGSFGDVFRAWDPRLRREVALKLISTSGSDSGRTASIIREGRLLARVRHPAVVTIYDAERIGTRVGLSMEFVEGDTLDQRVKRSGPLRAADALDIGIQLCHALTAAHQAGVLHRDVKAANVIMRADGHAVLTDFGAGHELGKDSTAGPAGTPMYLAPEVLDGGEATVQSDVYSLGVLLHYLMTGSYPVTAGSLAELRSAHVQRRQQAQVRSSSLPGQIASVLARATDPRPSARYESSAALASALAKARRAPVRRRWWIASAAAVVCLLVALPRLLTAPVTLAVTPFELSGDLPDADLLREGMARELTARLQTYDNARVISASSAIPVGEMNLSLAETAGRLDAGLLVTGTIGEATGGLAAVAVNVVQPGGKVVWSRSYERPVHELNALHGLIASDIAGELRFARSGERRPWPTRSPAAHALFIKGQIEIDKMLPPANEQAVRYFREALAIDPEYAQAHAALADAYLQFGNLVNLSNSEAQTLATESAQRAMLLDPSLPASHLAAAIIHSAHGEWAAANGAYLRALELGPSDAVIRVHYAHWLSRLGRFEQALEHAQIAARLDPWSARASLQIASVLRFAGQWEQSIQHTMRALELNPGYSMAYSNLGHNLQGLGRHDEAVAAFEKHVGSLGNRGNAYARVGRVDDALAIIAVLEKEQAQGRNVAGQIAQVYCGLNDIEKAFEWLERGEPLGDPFPMTFLVARVYDPLRQDPRFETLLKRYRLDAASLRGF